jgi:hypothetical protein
METGYLLWEHELTESKKRDWPGKMADPGDRMICQVILAYISTTVYTLKITPSLHCEIIGWYENTIRIPFGC